jgi:DNA-binding MarR family transcriptional regulator
MVAIDKQNAQPLMALLDRLRQCCEEQEAQVREETGLSSSEYAGMMACSATGKLSASELAGRMGLSASRVSRVVDRLVQRGLLQRTPCSEDRRAVELSLTLEGRRTRQQLDDCLRRCDRSIRARLTDAEMKLAGQGLDLVLGAMQPWAPEETE